MMTRVRGAQAVARPDHPTRTAWVGAWAPATAAGILTAGGYQLLRGSASGLSALLGVVIAGCFFASTLVLAGLWARRVAPAIILLAALVLYTLQMGALLGVYLGTENLAWIDDPAVGVAILVVALTWQVAAIYAWSRARTLIYDELRTP